MPWADGGCLAPTLQPLGQGVGGLELEQPQQCLSPTLGKGGWGAPGASLAAQPLRSIHPEPPEFRLRSTMAPLGQWGCPWASSSTHRRLSGCSVRPPLQLQTRSSSPNWYPHSKPKASTSQLLHWLLPPLSPTVGPTLSAMSPAGPASSSSQAESS